MRNFELDLIFPIPVVLSRVSSMTVSTFAWRAPLPRTPSPVFVGWASTVTLAPAAG